MSTKVLYAVLNWGLGHAARSIPIIKNLILENKEVIIASDGDALKLLKKEFPLLQFEVLVGYNIYYSKKAKYFDLTIFFQLVKLRKAIRKEFNQTQLLLKKYNFTEIYSDNRYGVYSEKLPSTFICHQMNIQHQNIFLKKIINYYHHKSLDKFKNIWVPDFKGEKSIAGDISILDSPNTLLADKVKYIGIQSRIKKEKLDIKYKICVIMSGPEPQRSIFERIIYLQLKNYNEKIVFIRGANKTENLENISQIEIHNLINTNIINRLINESEIVICRSGYSTIMDLTQLNKKGILIPTPGQTEQEYLAKFLKGKRNFYTTTQKDFNFINSIKALEKQNSPI